MEHLRRLADEGQVGTELRFKLAAGTSAARAAKVAAAVDCSSAKRVFRPAGKHEAKHRAAGLDRWYTVKCSEANETWSKLDAFLAKGDASHDGIEIVEPALVVKMSSWEPNDPHFSLQSHYSSIGLENAWELTKGDPSVVVQVIDSGLDLAHEDLQMNIWRNEGETDCNDGIDNDNNGFIDDCHGYNHADNHAGDASSGNYLGDGSHGTHCAGTIAADSNNGLGVAGVAGGDGSVGSGGASLMTSVVFGQTSVSGFAEALAYGADNGAQISSNSWGYTAPGVYDQVILDAIDYYNDVGGMVVFAAGNDGTDEDWYPAYHDGAVAVAALDDDGVRASFTCYGSWIDISAPGVEVVSTITVSDGSYGYMSGTSMACPHVSGVLAIGLS